MKAKWSSNDKAQRLHESFREFLKEQEAPAAQAQEKPGAQKPKSEYKTNDFCTEFPKFCTKVLGTQRANMPQVPDVDDFKTDLIAPPPKGIETNEPEKIPDMGQATQAYLNSSDDRGPWPKGDQVKVQTVSGVSPGKLSPTQRDIYMDNALKKVAAAESGKWQPWEASVLVSKDNYLLDGHHRWAATIIYNTKHPEDQHSMTIEKVPIPIKHLLKIANAYTDAAGGARHAGGGTTKESKRRSGKQLSHRRKKRTLKIKRNK